MRINIVCLIGGFILGSTATSLFGATGNAPIDLPVTATSAANTAVAAEDPIGKLYQESIAYCEETAKKPPAIRMIMDKVSAAAELLRQEGSKAFPKFKGRGSEFIYNGTYVWVHDMKGNMLMHPIQRQMEGNNILALKDMNGKYFVQEMNNMVLAQGKGWVEYIWPRPGSNQPARKVSYVCGSEVDGKKVVVACGVYDLSLKMVKEELQNLPPQK